MNWIVRQIWRLWRIVRRRHALAAVAHVPGRGDLPTDLGPNLYIVGEPAKWAVLNCPCGCGEQIDVNLMPSRQPVWQLSVIGGRATLTPSLWVPRDRCGSHFWLRENRVLWVDDQ